jgi:hypothetical protein
MTALRPRVAVRRMARFFRWSLHTPKPPDGQIGKKLSSPVVKNNPLSLSGKSSLQARPSRPDKRGDTRSSRPRGGMQWTLTMLLTRAPDADGEVVWSRRPDAGVKLAATSAGDGGKQARSPGRARSKPLKPLRGECRVFPGVTVVTNARVYYSTRAAAGAPGARHSLRPLIRGRDI